MNQRNRLGLVGDGQVECDIAWSDDGYGGKRIQMYGAPLSARHPFAVGDRVLDWRGRPWTVYLVGDRFDTVTFSGGGWTVFTAYVRPALDDHSIAAAAARCDEHPQV